MEPIRPDDDELRGKKRPTKTPEKKPEKPEKPKAPKAEVAPRKQKAGKGGGSGAAVWMLTLLLLAGFALGGVVWFDQQQRVKALEAQLEEADYWARQSKLALARFEGELSETGESLEQTGASMAEQLQAHSVRLASADEEIGKLWVLAKDQNRKQLTEQRARIDELESGLTGQREALTALQAEMGALGERLDSDLAGTNKRMDEQNAEVVARVDELAGQVAGVGDLVEQRLQRFAQERRLADEEVQTRLQALERQSGRQAEAGELEQARARLAELEETVKSIDSSRSQLTSRLVRLADEVDELQRRMATQ